MHDLPSQTLLQQANARTVSGEELEVFGKTAASRFMTGKSSTLNDAVVEAVKQAGLSPEQVKRVIEFTNTAAYLHEFKKEGAAHRYIHFHGGPASPSEVLKDLNDGGGGTVFDRGMADYNQPPPDTKTASARLAERNLEALEKTAVLGVGVDVKDLGTGMADPESSWGTAVNVGLPHGVAVVRRHKPSGLGVGLGVLGPQISLGMPREVKKTAAAKKDKQASDPVEAAFLEMFHVEEQPISYAEPWAEVEAMREKLATTRDNLNSDLSLLEGEFRDITDQLYELVKQAAMDGVPLGHVVQAWSSVTPGEGFVKAAFSHIGPRLAAEKVMSLDGVGASLTKQASSSCPVNMNHPLVGTFAGFCSHLMKLAEAREQRDICHQEFERIDGFYKKAEGRVAGFLEAAKGAGGLWGKTKSLASRAAYGSDPNAVGGVEGAVRKGGELVFGSGSRTADLAARAAGKTTEYAPHLALLGGGAVAGQEISDQLTYNPSLRPVGRALSGAKRTALSYVPGTDASFERKRMIAGGGFGPTSMMGAYG